jgi:3-hydroxyisobutyrate dehydrogenase
MTGTAGAGSEVEDGVMQVGYVGLGAMGGALARRLLLSRPLTVFDARAEAVRDFESIGAATPAPDAASLARECDVIMMCVPTSAVVREAIFGVHGLAEGLSPGTVIIDQTTGHPSETRAISRDLAELGVTMIDAPVSGGSRGAVAGTIAIICGGPPEAFERIRPVLADISPNIVYCGGIGNGHAAKLVQNAVAACNRVITLECVAAACKNGLTLDKMPEVVNRSSGWNGGAERIIPALRTNSPTSDFQMGLMVKDLRLAMDIGNEVGAPMLIANAVRGLFQICANEKGNAQNLDEIARLIEQQGELTFTDYAG